jgi:hypothetical protein
MDRQRRPIDAQQVRRPLTEQEEQWRSASDKGWRLELEPTGMLLFEFKAYSLGGLRKNWMESEARPIETMLPGIVATFIAAIPFFVEEKRKHDEAAERRRQAEQRRAAEERRRRLDDAGWRKFLELAGEMKQTDLAREFLDRIKASRPSLTEEAGADAVADWLDWVEARIEATDALNRSAADLISDVAGTNVWDYRD